jgi:hypothetical protein
MSIIFDVNGETTIVPTGTAYNSQYIKNLTQDMATNCVIIPQKYYNIVGNYISYLKGQQDNIIITDSSYFDLATYFDDTGYFSYLLQQLFDCWSQRLKVEINTNFNYDLQWLIYLNCSYDFLPNSFTDNVPFMERWTANNQNKVITVNGNTIYYNNSTSVNDKKENISKTYHTVDGSEVGYSKVTVYYPNGLQKSECNYSDGEKNGLYKK